MLKRIVSALLIALSLGAAMFSTASYACRDSDRTDCTSPLPPPPPDPPKLIPN